MAQPAPVRARTPRETAAAPSPLAVASALWLVLALVLVPAPASARQSGDQRALLTLSVNEGDHGEALVVIRGTDVLIEVATLERAGVKNIAGRRETLDGKPFVSLASLGPTIRFHLDESALSLSITADASHLGAVALDLRTARPALQYSRATSAFLNYGANWSRVGGGDGSLETGLSVGPALAQATMSWTETRGFIRGLTNVVVDDREAMRRWTVGDSVVSAKILGSGLLLGGLHLSREYSLDPYFIQFPTLAVSGTTLTPSTVEVYVNDRLVSREQVAPGSFTLANVPMQSGSSNTRVVVRDAFGREQQMSAPFYLTTTALARGLQDYDYSVGFPRVGGASSSWNYGPLSVLARHRYGFTDRLTVGFVAEGDSTTQAAGPTVNLRLRTGEVELAASGSRSAGASGAAVAAGYSYIGRPVTVGLRVRSMTSDYTTLTVGRPEDRAKLEASASLGAQLGRRVSLTLQQAFASVYSGESRRQTSVVTTIALTRGLNLFMNAERVRDAHHSGTDVSFGLSIPLATRTSGSMWAHGGTNGAGATAEIQRSLPLGTGYGYRARAATGDTSQAEAMFEAQGSYGHVEAGQEMLNGVQSAGVAVAGGLVAIGGGIHPTRPVVDSFALVRVPEVGGVRTFLNNQEIGRTNRRGDVLVSSLLPYYANRLAIADQDVPIDRTLETVEQAIAPPYRGGSLVVFRATERRSVVGTITIGMGLQTVVPSLGELTVSVGNETISSPIGRSGEFYLENLPPGRHPAVVVFGATTCRFAVSVPGSTAAVVRLGVLRCVVPELK
jgi:outer membrane usher protein